MAHGESWEIKKKKKWKKNLIYKTIYVYINIIVSKYDFVIIMP